jgi:hypothetical protein
VLALLAVAQSEILVLEEKIERAGSLGILVLDIPALVEIPAGSPVSRVNHMEYDALGPSA